MKYIRSVFILVLFTLILSGCNGDKNQMLNDRLNQLNNDSTADASNCCIETILIAIEDNNSTSIYNLFSKAVQNDGISKESIKSLLSLFSGKIDSWEESGSTASQSSDYGVKTELYECSYDIYSDGNHFVFSVGECVRDDTNEDNIGLTWIVVYPAGMDFPDTGDTGIYIFE